MTALASDVNVDLGAAGKHLGRVRVPLERPWQGRDALELPFCQIANGEGPTVLLVGGNHGDEYEGPIVLGRLLRELDPGAVQGRIWILPALNLPAVLARTRTSPIDGLNLNRVWPGRAEGTVTERIVHFVDTVLLSGADVFTDLHTGGAAFELIPMSMSHYSDDAGRAATIRAAVRAFGAPLNVELRLGPQRPTAASRAHERGLLVIGSETGGGGAIGPASLGTCERGVRNLLAHLEVLGEPAPPIAPAAATRFTRKWGHAAEVAVSRAGVFVPYCRLWDEADAGALAGLLYRPEAPKQSPETVVFPAAGLVVARHVLGAVDEGTVVYWIVTDASS